MTTGPSRQRPSLAFRTVTWVLALATLVVLAWGCVHVSEDPVVLGRYSRSYALLLSSIMVVAGVLLAAVLRPRLGLSRALANAYLLVGTTLVTLIAVEIGLRVINPWGIEFFHTLPYHMQGMVNHPVLGYVHPKSVSESLGKNTVSLNSHGLRNEEFPIAKPAGESRILVLGDSVAFGWGVSQGETFSARMEPLLKARTGHRWRVINAGVNGYNSEQEANWLRLFGLAFQPDVVLLVYVVNDVDPIFDPNRTTWRRYPTWPDSLPELLERVRSLSFLFQMTKLMQRAREIAQSPITTSITAHPNWPASRAALVDIAAHCKAAGIPFLVASNDIHDPAFLRELAGFGIPAIELEPAWQKVPPERQTVSRVDPHPGPAVHAEMAALLVHDIARRGWLGTH